MLHIWTVNCLKGHEYTTKTLVLLPCGLSIKINRVPLGGGGETIFTSVSFFFMNFPATVTTSLHSSHGMLS